MVNEKVRMLRVNLTFKCLPSLGMRQNYQLKQVGVAVLGEDCDLIGHLMYNWMCLGSVGVALRWSRCCHLGTDWKQRSKVARMPY